jgi:group I intron endonuclease
MIGIYIITNEINNKVYIGQVGKGNKKNFMTRFYEHYNTLSKNKYMDKNKKPTHLQCAWNKDGEENFTFDILEECTKEELNEKEKYWIAYYESDNPEFGYNKTKGGEGGIPSEETKKKMSEAQKGHISKLKGKKLSEEHKNNIKNGLTQEIKNTISSKLKGTKLSEETINKIRNGNLNKKRSNVTKQKMSESRSGEKHFLFGMHHNDKTKNKISESNSKFNKEQIFDILNKIENGICINDIAKEYNVSYTTIFRIKNKQRCKAFIDEYYNNLKN